MVVIHFQMILLIKNEEQSMDWVLNDTDWSDNECIIGERLPDFDFPADFFKFMNSTSPPVHYPAWQVAVKVISYVIVMTLALLGNVLVLLTVTMSKRLRIRYISGNNNKLS